MSALRKRPGYVDILTTILASNTSMYTKLIEASKVRPCGPGVSPGTFEDLRSDLSQAPRCRTRGRKEKNEERDV